MLKTLLQLNGIPKLHDEKVCTIFPALRTWSGLWACILHAQQTLHFRDMVAHTAQRQLIRTYCLCAVSAITRNVQGWHFTIHVTSLTWLVLRQLLTTNLLGQKDMATKLLIFWVQVLEALLNNPPLLYPHSNVEIQFIVCEKSAGPSSLSTWLFPLIVRTWVGNHIVPQSAYTKAGQQSRKHRGWHMKKGADSWRKNSEKL